MIEFQRKKGLPRASGQVLNGHAIGLSPADGRLSFPPETPYIFYSVGTAHQLGRDQFYGYRPMDDRVMRLIDMTHSTAADQILDQIATDSGRDRRHDYRPESASIMCRPPASAWRFSNCGALD